KELKSQAVISFWKNISNLRTKTRLGEELFTMHFEGFTELVRNRNSDLTHEPEDSNETTSNSIHTNSDSEDEIFEEAYYAYIIDLDNVASQVKPLFCSDDEWTAITSVTQIPTELPRDTPFTDVDEYTQYFSQRPANESTFRARFIEPIIEPGEISSASSATRRNFELAEGKRRRIGSKADGIGSLVSIDDKELLIFELSGAPTRLPVRHTGDDKTKLSECMVDALNNLLEDFKECEFELAKKLKVFGFQTEGFYCFISVAEIVGRGIYRRRTLSRFSLPTRVLDLYYLYDLFRAIFCLRNELATSLNIIQELKIAKARKLKIDDPVGNYMLRLPPS
ncbi:12423_t:CDS:2, partial [Cetraspora pellucida]